MIYQNHSKPAKDEAAKIRRLVIKDFVLWKWTTRSGKYVGCSYWSNAAIASYRNNGEARLIHEHTVPRAFLADQLLKFFGNNPVKSESVFGLLTQLCIGCVLTEEEDELLPSRMPTNWNLEDPWVRYRDTFRSQEIWQVDASLHRQTPAFVS